MGLEFTEICMAVEEEFGIRFADDDLKSVSTVDDFYSVILSKLSTGHMRQCRTLKTFIAMRENLAEVLGVPKRTLDLNSRLDTAIPRRGRRKVWRHMRTAFPYLPDLRMRRLTRIWVASIALVPMAILGLAFGSTLLSIDNPLLDSLLETLSLCAIYVLVIMPVVYGLTRPLSRYFPCSIATIRDLLPRHQATIHALPQQLDEPLESFVWRNVVEIISQKLGIEPETIRREQRIWEDLKAG